MSGGGSVERRELPHPTLHSSTNTLLYVHAHAVVASGIAALHCLVSMTESMHAPVLAGVQLVAESTSLIQFPSTAEHSCQFIRTWSTQLGGREGEREEGKQGGVTEGRRKQ